MAFSLWLTLLAACVVISFTPGAGAINTMGNSLTHGFRRAIWGILGQQAALVVLIAIVAAGVGVLVASSPVLFAIIRYAGAAYLAYLGIRLILQRPVVVTEPASDPRADLAPEMAGAEETTATTAGPGVVMESRWSMFRRGLWVNLLNPKAIVFFLAFLPQFIRPGEPLLSQYVAVAVTVVAVDIAVMWGFFALAAQGFRRFTRTARGQRVIDRVFGALFLAVAVLLAFLH
ncbi:LysE family transporter [Microbacterium dextranolyticum]|uniref:Threonine transporter RhtB n=1 Tax=Microbacterium dextranolyticum TaxID=36806 RepID=A0A9W6HL93_9MICO|nr:LysE family transporter [Microbacterium dextranolyticum]MBM7464247.1 homoserine/homoserine lactone efflux protein [Microbacterium dextranolyticum]GLJ95241.1 threonine transporter RhtB [Microbacterium dextranolyticum]